MIHGLELSGLEQAMGVGVVCDIGALRSMKLSMLS